ncbi:hypothetical protein GIB67_011427 [Kingdonia uniflora]|uniref:Homeobox domain-containing protein n=1 Tax=Kingdonia uniflora TaxID=39325 RepID=A0A7J7NM67_9MAGN|nr:hypothetical protein GIB67_011427 [Kingdonia uniflora]
MCNDSHKEAQVTELALELNILLHKVRNWFQNRRTKEKVCFFSSNLLYPYYC